MFTKIGRTVVCYPMHTMLTSGCLAAGGVRSYSRPYSFSPTTSYSLLTAQAVTSGLLIKRGIPTLLLTGASGSGSFVVVVLWLPGINILILYGSDSSRIVFQRVKFPQKRGQLPGKFGPKDVSL